jgi:hypothetical protein
MYREMKTPFWLDAAVAEAKEPAGTVENGLRSQRGDATKT